MKKLFTMMLAMALPVAVWAGANDPIAFADANVKALCIANWDTNGDNELSEAEAAAVTTLGTVFRSNRAITSFVELQYFTGLSAIDDYAFSSCSGLTLITIPNNVTSIGGGAFYYCSGLTSITIPNSVTSIGEGAFSDCNGLSTIVVKSGNAKYDSRDNCNAIIETSSNTLIVGCKSTTIPNSVTSIGNSAFSSCSGLTSIAIPNSVTSIGESAFYGCSSLTSIAIPNSVTSIGYGAFSSCSGLTTITISNNISTINSYTFAYCYGLTSIQIPNSVTSIGDGAFVYCSSLPSITIPSSVTSIGDEVFRDCRGLTSIVVESGNTKYDSRDNCNAIIDTYSKKLIVGCTNTIMPNGITSIGDYAFENVFSYHPDHLTYSIIIPNSVTSIGKYAFAACSDLASVIIPQSVTSIGESAFSSCSNLTTVIVENSSPVTVSKYTFYINDNATLYVPSGSKADYMAADYWKDFNKIEEMAVPLSSNITFADANMKAICVANWDTNGDGELSGLEAFTVTSIKDVFTDNESIKSFDELQYFMGLSSIEYSEFRWCTSLTSITIPSSVSTINYSAFSGCSSLTSIVVMSGNAKYDSRDNCNAIIETSSNKLILGCKGTIIPNSVTSIGSSAFSGCYGLTSIAIPNSVTSIGSNAFSYTGWYDNQPNGVLYFDNCLLGYKGDKPSGELTIADGTRLLADNAFYTCKDLTSVTIPSTVKNIGTYAFSGCSGLTSITIPSSITSIGWGAFDECSGLTSVIIPNGVTSIGSFAFSGCSGLTSVTIPNSVTNIGYSAFDGCNSLIYVTVENSTPISISSNTFTNRTNATLYVPVGSKAAYQAANYWKQFKEIVEGTAPKELAYAVYDNGTLTFKYGYFTPDGITSWDASDTGDDGSTSPAWKFALGENGMWVDKVTKVVFDPSFADARPKTCFAWFDCFRKLETIEGLEYLNTSEVTSMAWMFETCMNLTSLDLINFNTSNVTDMSNMFAGAVGMTTLDLSSFNTAKVTSTQCMFAGSESQAYGGPNKLKTIYVGDDWTTANVAYSDRMFECCPNLVGGNGTKFSAEHIDKTYACIDAPGTPGYLSKKGQTTITTWTVTSTDEIPAGTKYELDDITLTIGEAGSPNFKVDPYAPYDETFQNKIIGNEVNGQREGGTFYLFTPKKNGNLTVVVRQNVGGQKKFYVEESGRVMDAFNGILPETEEDVYVGTYTIPVFANLTYKIYCAGSKMGFYGFTFVGRNDTDKTNITFADEKVKALCVANWDTDKDGELSQAEAAAVTTLGEVFKENAEITSFDELRFFTGLTELTGNCFYTCTKLKSITIPSGVTNIEGFAFGNCTELEQICVDPGNTTYDSRIQCNAVIEKATNKLVVGCQTTIIPDGVTTIGNSAFWGRWGMSSMNLPESVKVIESYAFAFDANLESITLPEGLTAIGESAFEECNNLTEVRVLNHEPVALTNAETFSNRANATLCVPVGCKAAYEAASFWKDFKRIVEPGWTVTSTDDIPAGTKVELDDITLTIGQTGSPNFKVDPTYGAYNDTFKNPIIGNEVNGDKEDGTFYLFTPKKNGNLTVVVRQNVGNQKKFYVEESGRVMDAFNGILPETEENIYVGTYTISVFANLTYKIYCAGSKMGFYGFTFDGRDDAEWTNIAFADEKVKTLCVANWDTNGDGELSQAEAASVTSLGEVFKENDQITSFDELRFFTGLKDMSGWGTLYGCHSLKTIIIPAGVISLDGATLAGCDALEQISVDPANTVYDSRMGCNGVIETSKNKLVVGCINTIIPDNVTTIGDEAFHGRGLLTWIAIPESVTELEDGAFAWCGSLEDIQIPSGLKTIGGWAFNHTALRSITLPEGLTTIGESAFEGCDNLTEVKVLNPVPVALTNAETFSNQANATLYVPNKSITAYKEANIWKDFKGVQGLFTNQIYSDDLTAYQGCSTEMVINMDNEEEYTAYQFDLVLPQGFSLEKDENDKFVLTKGNRYPSNRSITITPHDGNIYRFVSVSMKNDVITGNSGALMTVSLVADENLEKKTYTAEIQNVVLTKTDESQLNAKSSTISITTKEVLMGDSNDDGTLNVTDAVATVNNILGRPSVTFNKVQADINRDRLVDIFDVILGLNLIRNNAVRADRIMSRAGEATGDKLTISDFTITSGDTKQVQIELTNEAAYIGFQFDLFLPEGITLTGYSVNSARVPEEIEVDMEQTDGCYRFIGVGLGTETISGTSGNIISITVKADENLKGRNLTGYLRDVKLSKLDGTGTTKAEAPFQITNTTSGDLSGNGSLGPEDVSALVDLIMSGTYEAKADLNGDNKVNAVDLVLLTNIINQK